MGRKKTVGDRIRTARADAGIGVPTLARAIGRSQNAVYRWEWGEVEPSLSSLRLVAKALGTTLGELVGS